MTRNQWIGLVGVVGVVAVASFAAGRMGSPEAPAPPPTPSPTTPAPATPAAEGGANGEGASTLLGEGTRFAQFGVGGANVKSILADGDEVWVGTSKGVVRYDVKNDRNKLYDHRNGLLADGVFSVDRVGDKIAVGTHGGGLAMFDVANDTWKIYNVPEGLGDAFVYDVLHARSGDVWIATWTGLNRVEGGRLDDPKAWTTFTVESTRGGLPNDWVYGLAEGADGAIWIATEGGVARFVDGAWSNWNHTDGIGEPYDKVGGLPGAMDPSKVSNHHARQKSEQGLSHIADAYNPNYIVAITVDKRGTPWFGTWGGGLTQWTGSGWRNFTTADGLPSNHVFMVFEDAESRLWVGTAKGLARMDGEKFQAWTSRDGLFADAVFSAAATPDGALWIGSVGGIARFKRGGGTP